MKSILVVCIGNICRSPMAEGVLMARLPGVTVSSAGTAALIGSPADETALQLMATRGIDISRHRARQVSRAMCQESELVLVMDTAQRRFLEQSYPESCGRVFRLGEFTKTDIPDPFRQKEFVFASVLGQIEAGVQEWQRRITKL
jgi:protein-tyrosine phosphatase